MNLEEFTAYFGFPPCTVEEETAFDAHFEAYLDALRYYEAAYGGGFSGVGGGYYQYALEGNVNAWQHAMLAWGKDHLPGLVPYKEAEEVDERRAAFQQAALACAHRIIRAAHVGHPIPPSHLKTAYYTLLDSEDLWRFLEGQVMSFSDSDTE